MSLLFVYIIKQLFSLISVNSGRIFTSISKIRITENYLTLIPCSYIVKLSLVLLQAVIELRAALSLIFIFLHFIP